MGQSIFSKPMKKAARANPDGFLLISGKRLLRHRSGFRSSSNSSRSGVNSGRSSFSSGRSSTGSGFHSGRSRFGSSRSGFRSGGSSAGGGVFSLLAASGQGHGGDQRCQQERLFHACILKEMSVKRNGHGAVKTTTSKLVRRKALDAAHLRDSPHSARNYMPLRAIPYKGGGPSTSGLLIALLNNIIYARAASHLLTTGPTVRVRRCWPA